jgi:hypothetical protein
MRRLLIAAVAAVAVCSGAQGRQDCGTRLTPGDAVIAEALKRAGIYEWEGGIAQTYTVPLTIHVVRRTDYLGGLTQDEVDTAIANVNAIWAAHDVEFCQFGQLRYINSDDFFYGVNTQAELDLLRSTDVIPNTINVYFVNNLSLDGDSFCGISSFSWSPVQGIVITNSCVRWYNPSTFAHELGHYLDLLHTHETSIDEECADGRNCDEAGDLLCDTPADPRLNREGVVDDDCNYVGTLDPPCLFDDDYAPDPTNVMSYAPKSCRTNLTAGQEGRALAALTNLRPELLTYGDCQFGGICGAGAGSCFSVNGSPGCQHEGCCAIVCAFDIFCCDNTWDPLCTDEARELCGGCGTDAAGNCYLANGSPGCRDSACCEDVCAIAPYCCDTEWDYACAELALELCSGCGIPANGPCDEVHPWGGCADGTCCQLVCEIEPTCCDMQWDPICVGLAIDLGCAAAGAGDECATATPIGEGTVANVTLSDNTGATGDDSGCAAGADVDEWYEYTPSCSGPVRISLCTEFTTVDIVLSVFDGCPGEEMVCSADPIDCSLGGALAAELDVHVLAGETYYVRVSAVDATPTVNFQGSLEIQCRTGCGSTSTGDCFSSPNPAYCDDAECCLTVCAVDPFCCTNFWDTACAEQAAELCGDCGSGTAGDCLHANMTRGCDQSSCCAMVCAEDPFCCENYWASLCASQAESLCTLSAFGRAHLPLGSAALGSVPAGLLVSGVGSSGDDGVQIRLDDDQGGEITIGYDGLWAAGYSWSLAGLGPQPEPPDLPAGIIVSYYNGADHLLAADFPALGSVTYRLRAYNGTELLSEQTNLEGLGAIAPVAPDALGIRMIGERDVATSASWDSPTPVTVYGGAVYPITRLTLTSEVGAAPDDPAGTSSERSLDQLRLLARGLDPLRITDELVQGCAGDVNGDDLVGVDDMLEIILGWATASPIADIDDSGLVDVDDLLEILLGWGPC